MNKYISLIISILFLSLTHLKSQNTPQFLRYNGVINGIHSYNNPVPFQTQGVIHDYGPRVRPTTNYQWHGGIDYNSCSGNDKNDLQNVGLAVWSGEILNEGLNRKDYVKYILTRDNNPNTTTPRHIAYLHIWNDCNAYGGATDTYDDSYGGCTIKNMDSPNQNRWAIVFRVNGNYTAIGPEPEFPPGKVTVIDNGISHVVDVQTYVQAGDPIAPIGTSCHYDDHLHIQALHDPLGGIGDENSKNPLEFLQNNANNTPPSYVLGLLRQNNSAGLQLLDDGSQRSTLKARVEIAPSLIHSSNCSSNSDFDIVLNHEKVEFFLQNSTNSKIQIQGQDYDRIQQGGKFSNSKIPDYMADDNNPLIGTWNRTGIEPHAYPGATSHDDYYFRDFVKRIHKDDIMGDNNLQLANCPDDARYPDGKYDVTAKLTTTTDATFESTAVSTIIDNFKPFIKDLAIKFKGAIIYSGHWKCSGDCMEFVVTIAPQAYTIASAADANKFEVIATFSESMDNTVALTLTQGTVLGAVSTSTASDNKVFTFSNIALKKGTFFLSDAKDLAGNVMLNMPHPTASTCVKIPTRSGSGWNNPDNVPDGAEDNYELHCGGIDLSWRPTNPYPVVFNPSTCTSSDGAIRIWSMSATGANKPIIASVVKGNANGGYTFVTVFDHQTINTPGGTPQIQGLSEGTYFISVTDASGCSGVSGPIHLVAQSLEVIIEAIDAPCNGMSNGEIKATIIRPAGATGVFKWTHTAPATSSGNTST